MLYLYVYVCEIYVFYERVRNNLIIVNFFIFVGCFFCIMKKKIIFILFYGNNVFFIFYGRKDFIGVDILLN